MILRKTVLVARLLAAESQLAACLDAVHRKKAPKPKRSPGFRVLWVLLSKLLQSWDAPIHIVKLAAVTKRHRRGFQVYWK